MYSGTNRTTSSIFRGGKEGFTSSTGAGGSGSGSGSCVVHGVAKRPQLSHEAHGRSGGRVDGVEAEFNQIKFKVNDDAASAPAPAPAPSSAIVSASPSEEGLSSSGQKRASPA